MRHRTFRRLPSALAAAVVAAGLAFVLSSAPALASGGTVRGEIVDRDGEPVANVAVEMIPTGDLSIPSAPTKSNKKGKFIVGLLRKSPYRLIAKKEGMRVYRVEVHIDEINEEDFWVFEEDRAPGQDLPEFNVTTASEIEYKIFMEPTDDEPGEFGTGTPPLNVSEIVRLMQEGEEKKVAKEIKKNIAAQPNAASPRYLWAYYEFQRRELDEAMQSIDKALELEPGFEGALLLKGKILEASGDIDAAAAAYKTELEDVKEESVRYDTTLALAAANQKLGNDTEAIAALEALVEMKPDFADAYRVLADLYRATGQTEKFDATMEKVAEFGADDPNVMFNMGANARNAGDHEKAASYFRKAIDADAEFVDAYLQLAYTEIALGDMQGAIDNLKVFIDKAPEDNPNAQSAKAVLAQLEKNQQQ